MSDTPVNPFDDAEEIAKKSMVLLRQHGRQ